jgi:hypothetical protein
VYGAVFHRPPFFRKRAACFQAAERRKALYQDFPFTIREVAYLLNLHIRHKNAVSLDADCPFCGESRGKLNLNLKKNVFKCNRCGESGGMLALYGKIYGVDNQTACREIKDALGKNEQAPSYQVRKREIVPKEPEIPESPPAPDAVRHKTYSMFFSMLVLADTHRQNLLKRGFTDRQIEENGYKSTPVFGFKKLTGKLLEAGCTVKGVPGFYQDKDGEWTIHFSNKSSGFLVPVRNVDGLVVGAQIRLDHPYDGRKYIWLSSAGFFLGTSSGSPVHLAGSPGEKTVFITEGPLKGDLAHALSGRTFGCVPGANQYANLPPFLQAMKLMGTENVYEAYDMDKLLKTVCRGDYNEKCVHCENYRKDWRGQAIPCEKKCVKRQNIQRGCRKLAEICWELELSAKALTWDTDEDGDWAEHVKGVDDYLYDLKRKNNPK